MTIEKAMDVLRLENDDPETKGIVEGLLKAVPKYLEQATGMPEDRQSSCPVCDTVTGFLLRLWCYPEGADTDRIQRVINDLLKAITVLARD